MRRAWPEGGGGGRSPGQARCRAHGRGRRFRPRWDRFLAGSDCDAAPAAGPQGNLGCLRSPTPLRTRPNPRATARLSHAWRLHLPLVFLSFYAFPFRPWSVVAPVPGAYHLGRIVMAVARGLGAKREAKRKGERGDFTANNLDGTDGCSALPVQRTIQHSRLLAGEGKVYSCIGRVGERIVQRGRPSADPEIAR